MTANKRLEPRRIGVCGSSRDLPAGAEEFCAAAGAALAKADNVVIVSAGTRRRRDEREDNLATDWYVVSAAKRAMTRPEEVDERIETVMGDGPSGSERFGIGASPRARGKTPEARRFSFVRRLDALFAVAGNNGTAQELALAAELGIPVLLVLCFGGSAVEFFNAYESDLV